MGLQSVKSVVSRGVSTPNGCLAPPLAGKKKFKPPPLWANSCIYLLIAIGAYTPNVIKMLIYKYYNIILTIRKVLQKY